MNVLVLMLDSLRDDFIGCHGHPYIKTPNIDALAAESTDFANTIAEYPITLPSRTALCVGTYTYTNRAWAPLNDGEVTLAQRLQEAGYRTCAFSDTPFHPSSGFGRGFDEFYWVDGGKCHPPINPNRIVSIDGVYLPPDLGPGDRKFFIQTLMNREELLATDGVYFPDRLTREGIKWLEKHAAAGQPFMLWMDYFYPHEPWDPPEPYSKMYDDPDYKGRHVPMPGMHAAFLAPDEIEHLRAMYAGCATQTDEEVGKLKAAMERLGVWDDTIVVLLSDHGEPLGEHGQIRKFDVPVYDELSKMIFMIRDPRNKQGKRVDALVQNTDLMPTLLPMLGIEAHDTDGLDLGPLMRGEVGAVREYAYSGALDVRSSIRTLEWKMIDNHGERENELFNIVDDPFELNNLAGKEPLLRDRLHRRLWEFGLKWSKQRTWRDKPRADDAPPPTR